MACKGSRAQISALRPISVVDAVEAKLAQQLRQELKNPLRRDRRHGRIRARNRAGEQGCRRLSVVDDPGNAAVGESYLNPRTSRLTSTASPAADGRFPERRTARDIRSPVRLQAEGVELVVGRRVLVIVPGAPIDHSLHNGWPVDDRSTTVETPQDLAGVRIECIHEA